MSERKKFEDEFKSFSHTFNESLCIIPNTDKYYSNIAQACWEAWQASKVNDVSECKWSQDEDGIFHTNCGNSFIFSEPDFTPENNGFKNCCYCGGLIKSQEKVGE